MQKGYPGNILPFFVSRDSCEEKKKKARGVLVSTSGVFTR